MDSATSARSPRTLDELMALPQSVNSVSLRGMDCNITDEVLNFLPSLVEYVNLSSRIEIDSLRALNNFPNLQQVICCCCSGISQASLDEFRTSRPDVQIDVWGCWQLRDTDLVVKDAFDKLMAEFPPF